MARAPHATELTLEKRRELFLAALYKVPNVTKAAAVAGVTRQTTYLWRDADAAFAALWDDALESSMDALEEALTMAGIRLDSPAAVTAGIFILKSRRRAVFGERIEQHHTGSMSFYVPDRGGILPPDALPPADADRQP